MDSEFTDGKNTPEEAVEPVFESIAEAPASRPDLHYEETPVINPKTGIQTEKETVNPDFSDPLDRPKALPGMKPPKASGSLGRTIIHFLLFLVLFGTGIWLSTVLRSYLPNGIGTFLSQQNNEESFPETPTPMDVERGPFDDWETYHVIDGAGGVPIRGISFILPPDVLSPICDSVSCVSQGTYLPGGTRFTVAPRGIGHALADFRGKIVSDAAGREFLTEAATVAGQPAIVFSGDFAGTTVSGYSFMKMRGVMIEVDDTLSLEFNHFTPSGVNADFASDDVLFEQILKTLKLPSAEPSPEPSPMPQY